MKMKPFKLERYFAKYEFSAPYLLCSSDCETFSVEELFAMEPSAETKFKRFRMGYTESLGNPELREEIAGLYKNSRPEHVIVLAGAQEGIFLFMNVLLELTSTRTPLTSTRTPGHVIVLSPAYQSLYQVAESRGCDVTQWHIKHQNQWQPDLEELERSIRPDTRAIVVNFPHSPTGHLPSRETYLKILDIARRHDLYLFSDEVYRGLEYHADHQLPSACDLYEKGVSLGVMSKAFGLAGLRIGWLVTRDKKLFDDIAAYKDYTTICSSGPSEFFAAIALRQRQKILKRNLDIIRNNLQLLDEFFERRKEQFEMIRPLAGPIAFPYLKTPFKTKEGKLIDNSERFCMDLLHKTGILLLPGNNFNCLEPDNHVRFGFGRKNLPEILPKLDEYLSDYCIL